MNTLNDLADLILGTHGYEGNMHTTASGVEKLYINDKTFSQYIEQKDGEFILRVFLRNHTFGEKYTKEQSRKCFEQRDFLLDELNSLGLGIEITNGFKGDK